MLLQPAARVARLQVPTLFVAGEADEHATLEEMKTLYALANAPKELWIIAGAKHVDFHNFAPAEYEARVLDFLRRRLKS